MELTYYLSFSDLRLFGKSEKAIHFDSTSFFAILLIKETFSF